MASRADGFSGARRHQGAEEEVPGAGQLADGACGLPNWATHNSPRSAPPAMVLAWSLDNAGQDGKELTTGVSPSVADGGLRPPSARRTRAWSKGRPEPRSRLSSQRWLAET